LARDAAATRAAHVASPAVSDATAPPRVRADVKRAGGGRAPDASRARLERVAAQLKTLYQMGRDLGDDENWSDALDRFLMALVTFMGASGSGLLLFSDRERSLSVRAVFHVDDELVARAIATIRDGWHQHARRAEIHSLESYGESRATSCLERTTRWSVTVIPLRHRGRALGFLLLDKAYTSAPDFQRAQEMIVALEVDLRRRDRERVVHQRSPPVEPVQPEGPRQHPQRRCHHRPGGQHPLCERVGQRHVPAAAVGLADDDRVR